MEVNNQNEHGGARAEPYLYARIHVHSPAYHKAGELSRKEMFQCLRSCLAAGWRVIIALRYITRIQVYEGLAWT